MGPRRASGKPASPFVLLELPRGGALAPVPAPGRGGRGPATRTRSAPLWSGCAGRHAAGFIAYEAGHALEPKLAPLAAPTPDGPPLLWFGLFDGWEEVDAAALLPDPAGAWAGGPRPLVERDDHEAAIAAALDHILRRRHLPGQSHLPGRGGDRRPSARPLRRDPAAGAGPGMAALVFTGSALAALLLARAVLHRSRPAGSTARPMKGTAPAGSDPEALIADDPKQRAENLMIVDLLRNDLSRVSKPGTVKVPALFAVETYPTVHQMTSTVTAELEDGPRRRRPARDDLPLRLGHRRAQDPGDGDHRRARAGAARAPIPARSAGLRRTARPRSMSRSGPWSCEDGGSVARLGLGSGIVADSVAATNGANAWRRERLWRRLGAST